MGRALSYKSVIEKILTLSSEYRLYVFFVVLFLLALIPLSFLESGPNLSICSKLFGKYCYSIGITRGVSALLKGNINLALSYNYLAVPTLFVMILIMINDLIFKIKKKL